MKTYAVCTTPEELRVKLVNYYRQQERGQRGLERTSSLKRDCDKYESRALFYATIAAELEQLVILEKEPELGSQVTTGMYL